MWRVEPDGEVHVLVIHRPHLVDWSFPKGKLDPTDLDDAHCALREVLEETGLRCTLGHELPSTDYVDGKGRAKHVRYWEMRPIDGTFTVNQEVDEVRWLSVTEAASTLTYPRDRDVLMAFAAFAIGA